VDRQPKERPPYAIASVDNALRLATMLQLEGHLTVSQAAERLGVARSTAHRLLTMLVYRDFAAQTAQRTYRAGPVLEMGTHPESSVTRLREVALPHMETLVGATRESANLIIRTGAMARFVASVECTQALRVGNREGMAFPAYAVSGGLVLLAELGRKQVDEVFSADGIQHLSEGRPSLSSLHRDLQRIRRTGFAVNHGKSERGVVGIGRAVHDASGRAVAGLSLSLPSVRFAAHMVPEWFSQLDRAARAIEVDLALTSQ
jgi:DNA-binding IclR family transcriptional regulator